MSQNRQSDTDRRNAEIDHQVDLRAGQNIKLLHEKLDDLHTQKLNELTQIIKEQQRVLHELQVSLVPESKEIKVSVFLGLYVPNGAQSPKQVIVNKAFNVDQPVMDNNKVIDKLVDKYSSSQTLAT